MDIEIRRNRDLKWTINGPSKEDLEKAGIIPPLTEEQKKLLDKGEELRRELEEKIWSHFDKNVILDLLGDMITRETHEIGYDFGEPDSIGMMAVKKVWVRPKKSEYEK